MAGPASGAIGTAPKRSSDRKGRAHTEQELLVTISTGRAAPHTNARIGRESVGSASGPASPILTEQGRRVGSLGPGLACESADAFRAVLRIDLPAGAQVFLAPTSGAGLICPAWARGQGFTDSSGP